MTYCFNLRTELGATKLTAAFGLRSSMRPGTLLYNLKEMAQQVIGYNLYMEFTKPAVAWSGIDSGLDPSIGHENGGIEEDRA